MPESDVPREERLVSTEAGAAPSTSGAPADRSTSGRPALTPELTGLLWMVLASLLFAVMSITARLASRSASWSTVAASRAGMGALVAFAFALRHGVSMKTRSPKLTWARSILGTLAMLTCFYALAQADLAVGDAVTLFATAPLFIALLSPWILQERSDLRLWALLLVAFAGVGLVAGPHLAFGALPALMALASAVFSAFAMMFLRVMRSGRGAVAQESAEAIALHFALVSFVVHLVICFFNFRVPTATDMVLLTVTGLAGGVAQLAMTRAYAYVEASRLGAMGYLGTVLSFALAVVFLGERPEAAQLAGAGLVVGAGVVLALSAARRPQATGYGPQATGHRLQATGFSQNKTQNETQSRSGSGSGSGSGCGL